MFAPTPTRDLQNSGVPAWPDLDAGQQREALAATWPDRLTSAFASGALLALLMAAASFANAPAGSIDWRAPLSLALAAAMLVGYVVARRGSLAGPLLAPVGLAAVVLTHLNLMVCVMERLSPADGQRLSAADPALVLLTLAAGTIWALRIDLSPQGFLWTAVVTAAILWMPWMLQTTAPAEFALAAAGAIATAALLRRLGAEKAFDVYRRERVWPMLWRKNLQAEVERQLLPLLSSVQNDGPAVRSSDIRGEESVGRLAAALLTSTEQPVQPEEAPADAEHKSSHA